LEERGDTCIHHAEGGIEGGVKAYDHADTTREMRTSARSTRAWGKSVNETERGLKD
jgi:hypothetical protein